MTREEGQVPDISRAAIESAGKAIRLDLVGAKCVHPQVFDSEDGRVTARKALSAAAQADPALGLTEAEIEALLIPRSTSHHRKTARAKLQRSLEARHESGEKDG